MGDLLIAFLDSQSPSNRVDPAADTGNQGRPSPSNGSLTSANNSGAKGIGPDVGGQSNAPTSSKDSKNSKDNKDTKNSKNSKDSKDSKDNKDTKDSKNSLVSKNGVDKSPPRAVSRKIENGDDSIRSNTDTKANGLNGTSAPGDEGEFEDLISALEGDGADMEEAFQDVMKIHAKLEKTSGENAELKNKIQELEKTNSTLKSEKEALEAKTKNLTTLNTNLDARVKTLENLIRKGGDWYKRLKETHRAVKSVGGGLTAIVTEHNK